MTENELRRLVAQASAKINNLRFDEYIFDVIPIKTSDKRFWIERKCLAIQVRVYPN